MKIVIDTNVVASAMFFGGRPKQLLELLVSRRLEAYASAEIITEYQETAEELCSRYPDKTCSMMKNPTPSDTLRNPDQDDRLHEI